LLQTGFSLLDVIEPQPPAEMLEAYPEFQDGLRMTRFFVFKAEKPERRITP
jgi:hypothetical protein